MPHIYTDTMSTPAPTPLEDMTDEELVRFANRRASELTDQDSAYVLSEFAGMLQIAVNQEEDSSADRAIVIKLIQQNA